MSQKILSTHLNRVAIVYLRQSSLRQLRENQESTARQYALEHHVRALGWPAERIELIDENLGTNGGFFTMHVNADWIRRDLDIGIQKAGESFDNLSDEEKDKRLILAYRICALGIIAHEGQH